MTMVDDSTRVEEAVAATDGQKVSPASGASCCEPVRCPDSEDRRGQPWKVFRHGSRKVAEAVAEEVPT